MSNVRPLKLLLLLFIVVVTIIITIIAASVQGQRLPNREFIDLPERLMYRTPRKSRLSAVLDAAWPEEGG